MSDEIREVAAKDFERAITRQQRLRLMSGEWMSGDVALLRKYLGLSQKEFAGRIGISINTLQNWEQGRRTPDGPAKALLRLLAKHPRLALDDLENAS
ncbi:MAG: helix-turn-helix domain-containing protein [Spirochaetaceae bacterium]